MLTQYLLVCLVFLCLGLLTEYFVKDNKPTPDLVLFHVFMWFFPMINVCAFMLLIFSWSDHVQDKNKQRGKRLSKYRDE